jgi:hypothetical protein
MLPGNTRRGEISQTNPRGTMSYETEFGANKKLISDKAM